MSVRRIVYPRPSGVEVQPTWLNPNVLDVAIRDAGINTERRRDDRSASRLQRQRAQGQQQYVWGHEQTWLNPNIYGLADYNVAIEQERNSYDRTRSRLEWQKVFGRRLAYPDTEDISWITVTFPAASIPQIWPGIIELTQSSWHRGRERDRRYTKYDAVPDAWITVNLPVDFGHDPIIASAASGEGCSDELVSFSGGEGCGSTNLTSLETTVTVNFSGLEGGQSVVSGDSEEGSQSGITGPVGNC